MTWSVEREFSDGVEKDKAVGMRKVVMVVLKRSALGADWSWKCVSRGGFLKCNLWQ